MIWGCSFLMSSAIVPGSIHFRPSMPETSRPWRMRSTRKPARSSPRARFSTERTNSFVSDTSADWAPAAGGERAPEGAGAPTVATTPPAAVRTRFDRAAFEESIGNDPALFASLVKLFLEVQPPRMTDLAKELEAGEADKAKRTAHTLVGSFRTMAMPGLGDLAAGIERALKDGDLAAGRQGFEKLAPEFAALLAELEPLREGSPA